MSVKILGIESSCDETAASVSLDGRTILSNIVASQVEEHKKFGGVVPEIASRRHCENILDTVRMALDEAHCTLDDLDGIAVTYAPGLIGALLVGTSFAKGLAMALDKPLIPVHHIAGHIATNYIAHPELEPPYLCLVASGGHSHIVEVLSYTKFRVIGRTRDDAAGEAFDKCARVLGYPYPGGVHVDKAAQLDKPLIFAIGNAPTALVRLYELIEEGKLNPALIIGVPVGFVNVVQSKELIMKADVPYIVARGRKGGSNIAACICNALLYMIDDRRD